MADPSIVIDGSGGGSGTGSTLVTYRLAPEPLRVTFAPQPDITAYELATILPFFIGRLMTESAWNDLGAAQRHVKRFD